MLSNVYSTLHLGAIKVIRATFHGKHPFIGDRCDYIDRTVQCISTQDCTGGSAPHFNRLRLLCIGFKQIVYVAKARWPKSNTIL